VIIWGSTGREIDQGGGNFYCPRCDRREGYRLKRVSRYFTLYFIPLFELENLGSFVFCCGCGGQYHTRVLNYEPPREQREEHEPVSMEEWAEKELLSGTPVEMAITKIANMGMPRAAAEKAVNKVVNGRTRTCGKCNLSYIADVPRCSGCGEIVS
jgi:hypothetical protein